VERWSKDAGLAVEGVVDAKAVGWWKPLMNPVPSAWSEWKLDADGAIKGKGESVEE